MRGFVTGAAGFVGTHLVDALLESGARVEGLAHPNDRARASRDTRLAWHFVDLLDDEGVAAAVERAEPEAIFHLGGLSDVGASWANARRTLDTNINGTVHVLRAAARVRPHPRVLIVGSAEIYGAVSEASLPIREEQAWNPSTPYAVSKLAQEMLGGHAAASGRPVLLARPFNHTGPGQAPFFVCSSFARQVAQIERGEAAPRLVVGNLAPRRDFTDARDTVRAYIALVERGTPGRPYNICTGRAVPIRLVLDMLLTMARCRIDVATDPERLRPSDIPVLMGSPARIAQELGWRARIPLERTLGDLLEYWRRAPADAVADAPAAGAESRQQGT